MTAPPTKVCFRYCPAPPVAERFAPVPPLATGTVPVNEMLGVAPPLLASGALAVTPVTPPLPVLSVAHSKVTGFTPSFLYLSTLPLSATTGAGKNTLRSFSTVVVP